MDQQDTTARSYAVASESVEREPDRSPLDAEIASAYHEIATLSDLVLELDRRTKPVQQPEREGYAQTTDDTSTGGLSPLARAVREQRDTVATVNDQLRTILAALQT